MGMGMGMRSRWGTGLGMGMGLGSWVWQLAGYGIDEQLDTYRRLAVVAASERQRAVTSAELNFSNLNRNRSGKFEIAALCPSLAGWMRDACLWSAQGWATRSRNHPPGWVRSPPH